MTIERFAALLDAYGADARRWPPAERAQAQAFAATHPRAGALLAEAGRLDDALVDPAPQVPHELRARILAAAPTPRQAARWALAAWARMFAPGAALVAAGVAGVMFGAVLGAGSADTSAQVLLAEAEPYDELVLAEGEAL